jgi:hypothetical protein
LQKSDTFSSNLIWLFVFILHKIKMWYILVITFSWKYYKLFNILTYTLFFIRSYMWNALGHLNAYFDLIIDKNHVFFVYLPLFDYWNMGYFYQFFRKLIHLHPGLHRPQINSYGVIILFIYAFFSNYILM